MQTHYHPLTDADIRFFIVLLSATRLIQFWGLIRINQELLPIMLVECYTNSNERQRRRREEEFFFAALFVFPGLS